ncbi:Sec-independent protein translocase subunit TatA [Streptomyces sp. NPDC058001]|uniref:Sec-independent protein translocase subunit TatA n=1 Tax=Streptomyces sp. NPDC058001 TaxID=3346300 RepID=UPI0036EF26D7
MFHNALAPWHLLVVALVVILVFGSKKLPDMARSLGKSARILKSEAKAMKDDGVSAAGRTEPAPEPQSAPHTISAAPGDSATSRPIQADSSTTR